MIKLLPNRSNSGMLDYSYGKTIRSDGIQNLSQDANYGWATTGARLAGKNWAGLAVPIGPFILPINCVYRSSRSENRGLQGFSRVYVYIESEGSIDWTVEATKWVSGAGGGPTVDVVTASATGTSLRGWVTVGLTLPVYAGSMHRILVKSDAPSSKIVYAVQVVEAPYQNLESVMEAAVIGDTWIGPYDDGAVATDWSRGTNDPDRATLGSAGSAGVMRRNDPCEGVNSVEISGDGRFTSTDLLPSFETSDILLALAAKVDLTTSNGYIALLGGALRIFRTASQLRIYHYNAANDFVSKYVPYPDPGASSSGWMDIVILCQNALMTVWVNGVAADDVTIPGGHNDGGYLAVGYEGHQIAMPAFFAGDISKDDATNYIDYRRHVNGIF